MHIFLISGHIQSGYISLRQLSRGKKQTMPLKGGMVCLVTNNCAYWWPATLKWSCLTIENLDNDDLIEGLLMVQNIKEVLNVWVIFTNIGLIGIWKTFYSVVDTPHIIGEGWWMAAMVFVSTMWPLVISWMVNSWQNKSGTTVNVPSQNHSKDVSKDLKAKTSGKL